MTIPADSTASLTTFSSPPIGAIGDRSRSGLRRLALVTAELSLVTWLVHLFRIESHAFAERVVPIAALGFLPHHFAPSRYRQPMFLALSVAAIGAIFGAAAIWLIGIVTVLLAIAHLPIAFRWRIVLLLGAVTVLAIMRRGYISSPWPSAIWPILASMLMFRLIAYVHDLRHQTQPVGFAGGLAYLLMLPNVAFTLFPVVDSAMFRRMWYDRPAEEIYDEGLRWMVRGIFQLLLYRMVYQYGVIAPSEVTSSESLVRYLLANFGLYLRVSGSFHLVVGLLHLYGYRLPETHRLFYLSSSFTDFWRRINIYWKDFMQKVAFAPLFYPLRRRLGDTHALTLATLGVFAGTWFFHGYQWFWLLGRWQWGAPDALFWSILAILLVFSAHHEARKGHARVLDRTRPIAASRGSLIRLGLSTAATFTIICTLWGLWTSPGVGDFLVLLKAADMNITGVLTLIVVPVTIGIIAVIVAVCLPHVEERTARRHTLRFVLAVTPVLALALVSEPRVAGAFGTTMHRVALNLRSSRLNRVDGSTLQRGYYEHLTEVDRYNGELWRVYLNRPPDWGTIEAAGGRRPTRDFVKHELVPSRSMIFHGAPLTTNSFGMRDREHALVKPAGTFRIALLGKSHVLGEGVADDSTFHAVAERALNAQHPPGAPRIEILNFAVSGYTPLQQDALLDGNRVWQFSPDVVLFVGHASDTKAVNHICEAIQDTIPIPYDSMLTLVERAGAGPQFTYEQNRRKLLKYQYDIVGFSYRYMADVIRQHGARPAWIYVPLVLDDGTDVNVIQRKARQARFEMLDTPEMFIGYDENALGVAPWDYHPSAQGHRIIADRLVHALLQHPALIGRARRAAR